MKPETQRLIDLSVKDNSITERQREIILKKAAMLGDDVDEVEFILAGYAIVPNAKVDSPSEKVDSSMLYEPDENVEKVRPQAAMKLADSLVRLSKITSNVMANATNRMPVVKSQPVNFNETMDAQPAAEGAAIYKDKNKYVAALLGIFLGDFGAHKFYLGKTGSGIAYLLFFWTYIPGIVGFIEGIIYLCKSDEDFKSKYGTLANFRGIM